jgi:hypothetical protein
MTTHAHVNETAAPWPGVRGTGAVAPAGRPPLAVAVLRKKRGLDPSARGCYLCTVAHADTQASNTTPRTPYGQPPGLRSAAPRRRYAQSMVGRGNHAEPPSLLPRSSTPTTRLNSGSGRPSPAARPWVPQLSGHKPFEMASSGTSHPERTGPISRCYPLQKDVKC